MQQIAYTSPFVPPEWIAAHGLRPAWIPWGKFSTCQPTWDEPSTRHEPWNKSPTLQEKANWKFAPRGLCPYAGELLHAAANGLQAAALVMATTCDQMRRAAGLVETGSSVPVFLLNVPATWQTPAARQYYRDELLRLGEFLAQLGGKTPPKEELARVMLRYDGERQSLRTASLRWPARQLAEAVLRVRDTGQAFQPDAIPDEVRLESLADTGVPLALVGGPLLPQDHAIFDLVEHAGARIVLDATETGQRTLPPPLRLEAVQRDPFEELVEAYHAIPDVFRRPNDRLYDWLGREMETRGVRGMLLRRYLWCDLWHAEWRRLKEWSPVPVLEIDVADDDQSVPNRTLGRLEAFLETLRAIP